MAAGARALWLRVYRAAIFTGIVVMIHRGPPPVDPDLAMGVSLDAVREYFPSAAGIGARLEEHGGHFVLDAGRNQLGFVVATSPDSDDIVGYSGPNNVLVAFGADGKALGISVLSSGDTEEHVAEVLADERFMEAFDGKTWEEIQSLGRGRVDGVSGATLTSLAIAEGIIRRVAGSAPSLRFPNPLTLEDARAIFPAAEALGEGGEVFDSTGARLGTLLSSAPHSDSLIGYSGPSEVLVGVTGEKDEIVGIAIRDTYDTEKYVGYVRDEVGFIELFNGKALADVAGFDLEQNGVEGVSGATMTSMTVARAVLALAEEVSGGGSAMQSRDQSWGARPIGSRGIGTVLVVLFGLLMAFTRLRGVRKLRIAFQLVLVGYLGLVNGDLISQALLVGWAENGMAWSFAPGLLLLVAAALLVPLLAGKQVYCHQLCPHGAAQQLLKNRLPKRWRWSVPPRLAVLLRAVPFLLLLLVVVVAVRQLAFNLVSIEPFDAYLFRVAGWASIVIAVTGLVASMFVPMAYCRYGCPTGALLNFLWGGGVPGKFSRRDGLALVCLMLAIGLRATG